jgi:pyridoxine 5-phosphate synthase
VTTEGGLDLLGQGDEVGRVAKRLADNGISVSVFIDPDPLQIERLSQIRGDLTLGFEINTDSYSTARGAGRDTELAKIIEVAELGMENGLLVYAGHGLNTDNVGPVAAIPQIEELNIGHSIVSRAVLIGMEAAVSEMLTAMAT